MRAPVPLDDAILDNVMWATLSGPQARFAVGTDTVRRYAPGFSPIVGAVDRTAPDLAALRPFCTPGEHLYCEGWSRPPPPGWQVEAETTMYMMVWDGALPDPVPQADLVPLAAAHAQQALDLALLTKPGPFGLRTIELGDYHGVFEAGRLFAMAGERMQAGHFREISGVCTHPDQQGRGHARRLMLALIRRQMLRGERPFLHVMRANEGARGLYERMGFRSRHETVVRVIAPTD